MVYITKKARVIQGLSIMTGKPSLCAPALLSSVLASLSLSGTPEWRPLTAPRISYQPSNPVEREQFFTNSSFKFPGKTLNGQLKSHAQP